MRCINLTLSLEMWANSEEITWNSYEAVLRSGLSSLLFFRSIFFCRRCRLKGTHLIMRVSVKSCKTFTRKSHSNLLSAFSCLTLYVIIRDKLAYAQLFSHFLVSFRSTSQKNAIAICLTQCHLSAIQNPWWDVITNKSSRTEKNHTLLTFRMKGEHKTSVNVLNVSHWSNW